MLSVRPAQAGDFRQLRALGHVSLRETAIRDRLEGPPPTPLTAPIPAFRRGSRRGASIARCPRRGGRPLFRIAV